MPSLVQANPRWTRPVYSRSARARAAKAAASTRSTGGSSSSATASSGGTRRRAGGRSSSPRASRWAITAGPPNRDATSRSGTLAKAPSVRSPSRRNRSTSSARLPLPDPLPDPPTGPPPGPRPAPPPAPGNAPSLTYSPPGRSSSPMSRSARNAGLPPAGTTRPRRAARVAAYRPSATPTWHSTPATAATWSISRSAAASSPPK